ncbi:MAG: helix-turn-helix transcriptional regulator [Clostridium sp.]|nr:helix-turn-helix transcriptional regulator [Clostridium sp.]
MKKKFYTIAVKATMDVIGGKWKPIILCNLRYSSLRPIDLQRKFPHISPKMLIQ